MQEKLTEPNDLKGSNKPTAHLRNIYSFRRQKKDDKIYVCKIKNIKKFVQAISYESSKNRGQTV